MKHNKRLTVEAITHSLKKCGYIHEDDYIKDISSVDFGEGFVYLRLERRTPPMPGFFPKATRTKIK